MKTRGRTRIALALFALLVLATAYSMRRWHQVRVETAEVERLRLEDARLSMGIRLKLLPTCVWVRDFLRAQVGNTAKLFAPPDDGRNAAVVSALISARSCVPIDVAAGFVPTGSTRQIADQWADTIDMYLEQLQSEIAESVQ